jgi:HD-like signal output (HDOD) protein
MPATRETISLRIDRSFETPSVPLVLTRIIQVLDDESSSSHELEQLIMHDPSLSARILRLANSAFYSFRDEVKTISHAIALLGLNLVKSLAIGVNIFESFTRGMKKEAGLINKLWMHSFGSALIGQEIWVRRSNRKEGEFAFLCGLLHDLGKVVFFKYDSAHYAKMFSAEKQPEDPDICSLESESYGMDHAAMGASLAKQWGLPPDLATVIRKHHSPLSLEMPLVVAISMADMLAKQNKIGYDGDCKILTDLAKFQSMLNMSAEEYARLQVFAESKRIEVEEFFLLPS